MQKRLVPLIAALLLCGCAGTSLSQRTIVRAVFWQKQGSGFAAVLLAADPKSDTADACTVTTAAAATPAQALSAAEEALPGEVFYGQLELAAFPEGSTWQQARQLGELLYERAAPAPEISLFLVQTLGSDPAALLPAMQQTLRQNRLHFGLQQLFSSDAGFVIPVFRPEGYAMRLLTPDTSVLYEQPLQAQLAAVLAGHAAALRCRFGSCSVNAKTNLVCDGETLHLYLRDTQLQELSDDTDGQDVSAAFETALCAAYGALCGDAAAAGADLYHFAFWRQCANKTGAADKPQPPRLIIVS